MLKQPSPARARKLAGSMCVALILGCGTWAAWAAQPARRGARRQARLLHQPDCEGRGSRRRPIRKGAKECMAGRDRLLVGADGEVKQAKVVRSEPAGVYDQAAIDARKPGHHPALTWRAISSARWCAQVEFRPRWPASKGKK
jgi:hypothetical protein